MWWKVIGGDDDFFVIEIDTFRGEKVRVPFTSAPDSNIIMIAKIGGKFQGFYDPYLHKQATELGIWDAVLSHEALHCNQEFIAPYYPGIDLIPANIGIQEKYLVPNMIEDVVINHTIWLWEQSPFRCPKRFREQNLVEKIIRYYKLAPSFPSHNVGIDALQKWFLQAHMTALKGVQNIKSKDKHEKGIDIYVEDEKDKDISSAIISNIFRLLNGRATSLYEGAKHIIAFLEPKIPGYKSPLYETRYKGKVIPQFVPMDKSIISSIYHLLDIYFARTYNMDLHDMRKRVSQLIPKKITRGKKERDKIQQSGEEIHIDVKRDPGKKKLIFDLSLKPIKGNAASYFSVSSHEKGITVMDSEIEVDD